MGEALEGREREIGSVTVADTGTALSIFLLSGFLFSVSFLSSVWNYEFSSLRNLIQWIIMEACPTMRLHEHEHTHTHTKSTQISKIMYLPLHESHW